MDDILRRHISALPTGRLILIKGGRSTEYSIDLALTVSAGKSLGGNCQRGSFRSQAEIIAQAVNSATIAIGKAGYRAKVLDLDMEAIGY